MDTVCGLCDFQSDSAPILERHIGRCHPYILFKGNSEDFGEFDDDDNEDDKCSVSLSSENLFRLELPSYVNCCRLIEPF